MRIFSGFLPLVAAFSLGSCGETPDLGAADQVVSAFHGELDREAYDEIWTTTSTAFKGVTTQTDFRKIMLAVHTKLGKVKKSVRVGWQKGMNTGGSYTQIKMETNFEKGKGQEEFIIQVEGGHPVISGYHINSADMMLN